MAFDIDQACEEARRQLAFEIEWNVKVAQAANRIAFQSAHDRALGRWHSLRSHVWWDRLWSWVDAGENRPEQLRP